MILSSNPPTVERAQPWLGTLVSLQVTGLAPRDAELALQAAFAEVRTIHKLMSFHDPLSEVSRLNALRSLDLLQVHPYTFQVLRRALEISDTVGGCFDVTVGAELVAWGHLPRPAQGRSQHLACWRDIELLPDGYVRVHRPLCLDFGGIAKGFAVDRATEILAAWGAQRSVVNAGGDLRVHGEGSEWIALAAPAGPEGTPVLALENGSVASSGTPRLARLGEVASPGPHVDGRSRTPAHPCRFVSVLAPECIVADALTKVVMAQGVEAHAALASFGAQAYLHDPEGGWQSIGHAQSAVTAR